MVVIMRHFEVFVKREREINHGGTEGTEKSSLTTEARRARRKAFWGREERMENGESRVESRE
jgi:hypothetical protein